MTIDKNPTSFGPPVTAFAVLLVAAIIKTVSLTFHSQPAELVASSIAFSIWCIGLLIWTGGGSASLGLAEFRLGSWLLAFSTVAYGVAAITILAPQTGPQALLDRALFPRAQFILAAGMTAFSVGYLVTSRGLVVTQVALALTRLVPQSQGIRTRPIAALVAVYGVGLTATAIKIATEGGYGYIGGSDITSASSVSSFSQILGVFIFLRTSVVFAIFFTFWQSRSAPALFAMLPIVLLEALIGLLSGVKESFVILGIAALLPAALQGRNKLPWKRAVAALLIFVAFVTPFVTNLREDVRSSNGRLDFSDSVAVGVSSLTGESAEIESSRLADSVSQVASRIRLIDNLVIITQKTPSPYPYRSPAELVAAPVTGVIPRAIWRDKPVRLDGLDFYKTYYEGAGVSSSAISLPGSFYLYGGGYVMLTLFVLYGVALRAFDNLRSRLSKPASGLIALTFFVPIVKQELDAASLLAAIPVLFLTFATSVALTIARPTLPTGPSSKITSSSRR